ncbi:MAG: gephyrin-like molybdotransferase Glp [Pseudomonadota bacterium]
MTRPPLMAVSEARAISQRDLPKLGSEWVLLAHANNRVLASVPLAKLTQPPFPASAMDGYALRAEDLSSGTGELEVVGESAAGHGYHQPIASGTCVRIFTGAPVPQHADTIAIQENATPLANRRVKIDKAEQPGRYIRPAGGDFQLNQELLATGTRLTPQNLALLAAAGHQHVEVRQRPLVAIISTGDELVPVGTVPDKDQIISSNATGVVARIEAAGGTPLDLGIVADEPVALESAFEQALNAGAQLVLTLGGASAGDHDLVRPVFEGMGGQLDLYRIAMRPGKPFMVGRLAGDAGELRLLGLPGNPVSSLVCTKLFAEPIISALMGATYSDGKMWGTLAQPLGANDEREDYSRCLVTALPSGSWSVTPFAKQDSSLLHIAAASNALLCRPVHQRALSEGDAIQFMFW